MCDHRNARIQGHERVGMATCPDCGQTVHLCDVLNMLLDEMHKVLEGKK